MPGRKRYDALKAEVDSVQLPEFIQKDGSFYLDPAFDGSAWETLKSQAGELDKAAKSLQDHPHLHDSHKALTNDLVTATEAFQGMTMNAYNEWRAQPEGQDVKQTEAMVGLGSALQLIRGMLGKFDQGKLDAATAVFGR